MELRFFILLFIASTCLGRDCVQGAIYLLALRTTGVRISYEDVLKEIPPNTPEGTDLELIPKIYELVNPGKKLEIIYTFAGLIDDENDPFAKNVKAVSERLLKVMPMAKDQELRGNRDYLWIGNLQEGAHCALVRFKLEEGNFSASIINYQRTTDGKYYTVQMGAKEFFSRTYFVLNRAR